MGVVRGRVGEGRLRDTELRLSRVINGVESLEERHPVDEVQALAGGSTHIDDDEVDNIGPDPEIIVQLV